MRCVVLVLVVAAASVASAAPSSNPTFLGIEMSDLGAGCQVTRVTTCSPAKDAGFRERDVVVAMDGKTLFNGQRGSCDVLRERIMAHTPGEVASYDVRRGSDSRKLQATLSTRAEVQHRCLVGEKLSAVEVSDFDNAKHRFELGGGSRGRTSVIGLFDINRCVGCGAVFDAISDGIAHRLHDTDQQPSVLGVTPRDPDPRRPPSRRGFGSTVTLALADPDDYEALTLKEPTRMQLMVVDCGGIIRFVALVAPGADDVDAAVDEVLAAVEQTEHLRTQRR